LWLNLKKLESLLRRPMECVLYFRLIVLQVPFLFLRVQIRQYLSFEFAFEVLPSVVDSDQPFLQFAVNLKGLTLASTRGTGIPMKKSSFVYSSSLS